MKRLLAPAVLAPLLTIALLGCGSETGSDAAATDPTAPDLDGSYVATSLPDPPFPTAPERVTLTLDGDTLAFAAGCNGGSGELTWSDGRPQVGPMSHTEMGCEQVLMDRDDALRDFLTGLDTLEATDDGGLLARSGDTEVSFLPADQVPDPAAVDLEGTPWRLTSTVEVAGDAVAMLPVPRSLGSTLRITGRRLLLETGCNGGSGPVEVGEGTLEVGPLATTKMACDGERGDLERLVLGVVTGAMTWTISADTLTLTSADGTTELVYVAG